MRNIIKKNINVILIVISFIATYILAQSTSTVLREYNSMEFLNSSNKLTLRGVARDFWLFPDNKSLTNYDGTNIGISASAVGSGLLWENNNRRIKNAYYPAGAIGTNTSGGLDVNIDDTVLEKRNRKWGGATVTDITMISLQQTNLAKIFAGLRNITEGSQYHNTGLITDNEKNVAGGDTGAKVLKVNIDDNTIKLNNNKQIAVNTDLLAKIFAGLRNITEGSQYHNTGLITDNEKNVAGGDTGGKVLKVNIDNNTIKLNNNKQIAVNTNLIPTINYGYHGLKRYTNNVVVEFNCTDSTGGKSYITNAIKQYEGDLDGYSCTFKFKWKHPIYNGSLATITDIVGATYKTKVSDIFDLTDIDLNFANYFCGRVIITFEILNTNNVTPANSYNISGNTYIYAGFLRVRSISFGNNGYLSIHSVNGNGSTISSGGNTFYCYPVICNPKLYDNKANFIFNQTLYTEIKNIIIFDYNYTTNETRTFYNDGLFLEFYNVFFGVTPNNNHYGLFTKRGITLLKDCQTFNLGIGFNYAPFAGCVTRTIENGITKIVNVNAQPLGLKDYNGNSGTNAHSMAYAGICIGPSGIITGF